MVADLEVDMADMEVDMVADIEVDMVADIEVDMAADMELFWAKVFSSLSFCEPKLFQAKPYPGLRILKALRA